MERLTRLLATAALLLASLSTIGANPGSPSEDIRCLNLTTGGSAQYVANKTEDQGLQDPLGNDIIDEDDTTTYTGGGTASGSVELEEPSCPWADYEVTVLDDDDNSVVLGTETLSGRDTQSFTFSVPTPDTYTDNCVDVVATTSVRGEVIDESRADNICDGGSGGSTWGG